MKNKVSVVIVTRNRENDLKHCLGSLACQKQILYELVVVDNNSRDNTKLIVENFSKNVTFKVKYVLHKKIGYPAVRNRGLKEVKGNWVAFIDDDCIADYKWYERIKITTNRFPHISAILGKSKEYFEKNIMALSRSYFNEVGKIGAVEDPLIIDQEILDSKNIIYNKIFLDTNNITFDEDLLNYAQGASEDCDLGMQIQQYGGVAIYDSKIIVTHKSLSSFIVFIKKTKFYFKNYLIYEKKWKRIRKNIKVKRSLFKKIFLFNDFCKIYQLNLLSKVLVFVNIIATFLHIKVLRLIFKKEISSMKIKEVQKKFSI